MKNPRIHFHKPQINCKTFSAKIKKIAAKAAFAILTPPYNAIYNFSAEKK